MNKAEVIEIIFDELRKAEEKHPGWPSDVVHAAAILGEEAGEVVKAALDLHYGGFKEMDMDNLKTEAAQTGAMAIRLLVNLP